jgi:hypothetical protein
MEQIHVNIFELVGSHAAVSMDEGEKLYNRIIKAFENKTKVVLDFNNIELLTSTFLNSSIGKLYGKYKTDFIKLNLSVTNLLDDDLLLLKKVVDRAKQYFYDKAQNDKTIREILGDDDN